MAKAKVNKTEQNSTAVSPEVDPYEQLDEKMRQAIDMRLEGINCRAIGMRLNISYQTARWYFYKGGPCFIAYKSRKKLREKERKELFKEVEMQIKDMAIDVVVVLREILLNGKAPAAARVAAGLKVLEMAGFAAVQKIEDVTKDSEGVLLLRELITHDEQLVKSKNKGNRKNLQTK